MIFLETKLPGSFIIEPERVEDPRGFFARVWCTREAAAHGIEKDFVQCNVSFNAKRGTLRGMHYQHPPHEEARVIRCTMGAVYDVIVDVRPDSTTYKEWVATELTAENRRMIYIPEGFAHGFLTTMDGTEVFYQMSAFYAPDHTAGLRWDDPAIGVRWPLEVCVISERDRSFPRFQEAQRRGPGRT